MEATIIKRILQEKFPLFFLLSILFCLLQGCAHSDASRSAGKTVDNAYLGVTYNRSELDVSNNYQNLSQTSKGAIMGGVTGGVVGGASKGVGVPAGAIIGAILGGAIGAYIDAHSTLVDKLRNRAVKVFVLGDQVLIVLPTNRMFHYETSKLRYTAYSTLDLVRQLIGNYINVSVKISAYSNRGCNPNLDYALTQQQAEAIERYLWKTCVNTRLLYAAGYGGANLVTKNCNDWDSDNNRIEITFEKMPEMEKDIVFEPRKVC